LLRMTAATSLALNYPLMVDGLKYNINA